MISIRNEGPADHARVREIQEAAFARPDEARLVEALRRSARPQLSLVAELDGELTGHLFLAPVAIDGPSPSVECAGLAPIAIDPVFQRSGIGSALVRESLRRCSEVGWQAVFLLGDPNYYGRFAFELAAPAGFHYESEIFDSVFQLLEITSGALDESSGWVRYHEAFNSLS